MYKRIDGGTIDRIKHERKISLKLGLKLGGAKYMVAVVPPSLPLTSNNKQILM